ncbi:protein TolA [Dechloromonas sp. A34]|uniref:protein TolA n=1 Tax=Dechloromonas sp. A34 TaxID=447588 RepID=UPI002B05F4D2|nr:protein TolA [Dechloromonas sp. A34]
MIDQIREEPGKKYALTFTILVHVGLLVFLFLGVQWKSSKPEVMEVELWSAQPTPATYVPPPPPPPEVKPEPKPIPKVEPKPEPPPPKKPDIAIKQEKKPEPKKPEPPKPEPKKPEPKPEPKKPEPRVDPFKEMLEREEKQRSTASTQARMAAAAEAEQRASASKRGMADYASKIRGKVRGNIVLPPAFRGTPRQSSKSVNCLPVRFSPSS